MTIEFGLWQEALALLNSLLMPWGFWGVLLVAAYLMISSVFQMPVIYTDEIQSGHSSAENAI